MDLRSLAFANYEQVYERFRWEMPRRFNIGKAICDAHLKTKGQEAAILYRDENDEEDRWSFADLSHKSNQIARLLDDLGLDEGERVGVCLSPRPELVAVLAAIYKKGCIALSISSLLGDDAVIYRLGHCGAKAVFLEGSRRGVRQASKEIQTLEHVMVLDGECSGAKEMSLADEAGRSSGRFDCVETLSDAPAQLFYTSGTTGPPKGTLHAHRFLLGHLPCFQVFFELAPEDDDVFWTPADWGWIGALGDLVLPSLCFGKPIVVYKREGKFEPDKALEVMERYAVTCAFIPPTALRLLKSTVEHPRREHQLKLRAISSAGESVGTDLLRWARSELGVPVNEFYGCTEVNLVLVNSVGLRASRAGSLGRPCPGHVVEIMDENGAILPAGNLGEIVVRSPDPVMFLGYWDDPEATSKRFRDSWFLTGDLGYKDVDGYVWFKGRNDDLIKSAGYRIGPEEVERVINLHPAVFESAVVGKPDALRGNIIKAFVVLREGCNPSEEVRAEIQSIVKEDLAAYAYPREIEFISEIPKTITGKLKRYELRKR